MKNKNAYLSTLKWGAVLGVMLAAFELVKMFARRVDFTGAKMLDLALIIGFILVLYAGIKEFKELYSERLSFAKAFLGCLLISIVGSVIFFGYCMLHYAVIEPNGLATKYEVALDNYRKIVEKDTITQDEIKTYLGEVEKLFAEEKETFVWPDTANNALKTDANKGFGMIYDFFLLKITDKKAVDTAENYRLGHFDQYARRTLVETTTLYMGQNESLPSTPFVQQMVQDVSRQLDKCSPADARFAMNKAHVPHYDKPGRYAGVAALMDLLYGMFFGLFIAMYHYTSKKTPEPVEDEELFTEDESMGQVDQDDPVE
ncbi:MAG: DUF4199 domain-containing protein [Bacteroidales bacterium]|nr:DUF4199 domain-containing protein [Bacteroidales bacterium]